MPLVMFFFFFKSLCLACVLLTTYWKTIAFPQFRLDSDKEESHSGIFWGNPSESEQQKNNGEGRENESVHYTQTLHLNLHYTFSFTFIYFYNNIWLLRESLIVVKWFSGKVYAVLMFSGISDQCSLIVRVFSKLSPGEAHGDD